MSIFGATGNSLFTLGSDQGIDNTVEQAKFIINGDNKYELQLLMSDSTIKKTVLPINQTLDASSNVAFNALQLFNPLDIAHGGTGSKTVSGARSNLGLGSLAVQSDVSVNINGGSVKGLSEFSCVSGIASSFRATNLDVSSQANIANLDTSVIESIGNSLSIGDNSGCSSITIGCGNNVQTVNIGSVNSGQTTVNIGSGSDIVNIAGSLNYIQSTNLEVNDKTITINKGSSGSGTARGSALLIRDNSIDNAGYIQVNNSGNAFELKAPENNFVLSSPVITQNDTIVVSSDSRLTNARQCNNTFVDASASRVNLGLTSIATASFGTGAGSVCEGNDSRLSNARQCNNTFVDASASRVNLGLTPIATASYGTTANSVCQGNDSRLSDARQCNGTFTDVSASRSNLGLGTMSTQSSSNVNITGGTITGVAGLGSKWSDASGSNIYYNAGSVGIGTTTIPEALSIQGNMNILSTVNGNEDGIKINNSQTNNITLQLKANNSNNWVRNQILSYTDGSNNVISIIPKWNSGSPRVVFPQGNVGIGTSNSSYPLDVAGNVRIGDLTGNSYIIHLGRSGVGGYRAGYIYGDGTNMNILNQQSGDITLNTNNSSSQFVLKSTGNLGLGTSSPNANIEISNTATTGFNHTIRSFIPSLAGGSSNGNAFVFGVAPSTRNSGYIAYKHLGAGLTTNFMSIGLWGVDDIITADGNTNVAVKGLLTFNNGINRPVSSREVSSVRQMYGAVNMQTATKHEDATLNSGWTITGSSGQGDIQISITDAFGAIPIALLSVGYSEGALGVATRVVGLSASSATFQTYNTGTGGRVGTDTASKPVILYFSIIGR